MKGLIAHAILAVGGLGLAYSVWTGGQGPKRAQDQVTVWDCDAGNVSKVHLLDEHNEVTLQEHGKGEDAYWEITQIYKPAKGQGAPKTYHFTASAQVHTYLKKLAPLLASRDLGELDKKTLKEVGLRKPKTKLSITCSGKTRTFVAGEDAFGSGQRYLRDARGGSVYLMDASVVRELGSPQVQLMQRSLKNFQWADVAHLKIEGYGKKLTLLQRNRDNPRTAEWVDASKPDKRNEMYGNWLNRLRGLTANRYLQPGEKPGGDGATLEPIATLTFQNGDGKVVDQWKLDRTESPTEVGYYARSRATRAWVELPTSLAKDVAHDVRPVLGLDPVDEPEPVAPAASTPASPAQSSSGAASQSKPKAHSRAKPAATHRAPHP